MGVFWIIAVLFLKLQHFSSEVQKWLQQFVYSSLVLNSGTISGKTTKPIKSSHPVFICIQQHTDAEVHEPFVLLLYGKQKLQGKGGRERKHERVREPCGESLWTSVTSNNFDGKCFSRFGGTEVAATVAHLQVECLPLCICLLLWTDWWMDLRRFSLGHPGGSYHRLTSQLWMEVSLLFVEWRVWIWASNSASEKMDKDFSRAESTEYGGTQKEMTDDNQELPPSLLSKHTRTQETHAQARAHTHRSTNR